MDVLKRIEECGLCPVVVIDNKEDALPTAEAMLKGGIDIMEVTFRTEAAADSIKLISEKCKDVVVGAGTVTTLEQCKKALEMGAKFIVCPGFDYDIAKYCVDKNVPVVPGCVTPTEIMAAMKLGIKILKFFPANIYGGIAAMKSLTGPFKTIRFIPTGGVNANNLADFVKEEFIFAVGGSWVCTKKDISEHNFDKITALCKEARTKILGYELGHLGMNFEDEDTCKKVVNEFKDTFGFETKDGATSMFASDSFEMMKKMYYGKHGHIGFLTNKFEAARKDLENKGFKIIEGTEKFKGDRMVFAYFDKEIGGFAIHIKQK